MKHNDDNMKSKGMLSGSGFRKVEITLNSAVSLAQNPKPLFFILWVRLSY